MYYLPHEPYYHDRLTEYDLCNDFPGDRILIDGLRAMQVHFWNNNVNVEIPVVRVMNAVHFLAAYMFATMCSGDQQEYDVLAYSSIGQDKQLVLVTMIVLAALLKRTEGFRASQCRNVLLENRSEDFYEGVTLYDRFLRSAEKHFAEEEFLLDTHKQIQDLQNENAQLTSENIQLKYTINTMEKQQNILYKQDNNQGSIYNAPVYITYTTPPPTEPQQKRSSEDIDPIKEDTPTSRKQGRRNQRLFIDEDTAIREKNRFMNFLHLHNMGTREFDSSEDSQINQIAVCFYRQWLKLDLLDESAGATAFVRFLKDDCQMSIVVVEKTLGNVFSRMINSDETYPNWCGEICAYFNE